MSSAALRQTRNLEPHPHIEDEGRFTKRFTRPSTAGRHSSNSTSWSDGLPAHERLHHHQTLNSGRRFVGFRQYVEAAPQDALDRALRTRYRHNEQLFASQEECARSAWDSDGEEEDNKGHRQQPGLDPSSSSASSLKQLQRPPRRRLRNTRDVPPDPPMQFGRPLVQRGGVPEQRPSPDSVRLMCSGHHSTQTNPGYSRQAGDGNFFMY